MFETNLEDMANHVRGIEEALVGMLLNQMADRKERFRLEMEEYNKKRQNAGSHLPHNLENSDHTFICRQYG